MPQIAKVDAAFVQDAKIFYRALLNVIGLDEANPFLLADSLRLAASYLEEMYFNDVFLRVPEIRDFHPVVGGALERLTEVRRDDKIWTDETKIFADSLRIEVRRAFNGALKTANEEINRSHSADACGYPESAPMRDLSDENRIHLGIYQAWHHAIGAGLHSAFKRSMHADSQTLIDSMTDLRSYLLSTKSHIQEWGFDRELKPQTAENLYAAFERAAAVIDKRLVERYPQLATCYGHYQQVANVGVAP
jgi:hypothetical protein